MTNQNISPTGLQDSLAEDRRDANTNRFEMSNETLDFKQFEIADPMPTGEQILAASGIKNPEDCSLFALLKGGDFEEVRLKETFNLRAKGVERFIYFRSDRTFRFGIENRQLYWGKPKVMGSSLITLAELEDDESLFLEVKGGTDLLVTPEAEYTLSGKGIERFIIGQNPNATYEILVNSRPKTVTGRKVTFEQAVELAFPGPHDPNDVFSVTYRKASSHPAAGELTANGSVLVKNGTIFNVTQTYKS